MKKITAILLCLCALVCMTACTTQGNTATPTPMPATIGDNMPSPDVIPEAAGTVPGGTDTTANTAEPETDAGIGGAMTEGTDGAGVNNSLTGGTITDFEEGRTVDQGTIPEIVQAIKTKYPDASITGVSMATHGGQQVYHVQLDGAADTKEIYVDPQGNITPYVAGTGNANA